MARSLNVMQYISLMLNLFNFTINYAADTRDVWNMCVYCKLNAANEQTINDLFHQIVLE